MSKAKINVVIPYLAGAAQGRELEMAVAGWRQHFQEPHRIVIVGDEPGIQGEDIVFIPCPRVPGVKGQYRPHLDHVHKFREVRKKYPRSKGFVYTCDDIYAVKDFTLEDIQVPKVQRMDIDGSRALFNAWVRDNVKTRARLVQEGLPTANWVCHLPVWYDWKGLIDVWDRYGCDTRSYVVENLYFNERLDAREAVLMGSPGENYRHQVWRKGASQEEARAAMSRVTWMVNSRLGWAPWLEEMLLEYYGLSK